MHFLVRISTTTQYKSVYVIFEQFEMLAFPLFVCNISQAWVKYENKLCCSSRTVAFYKGGWANGSEGREDAEIHMN